MPRARGQQATISSEWRRGPDGLVRELRFRDYECALAFAGLIGQIEDFGHHADICVMHDLDGRLTLTVRNLNHGHITQQELRLARKLDAAISESNDYAYGTGAPGDAQSARTAPKLAPVAHERPASRAEGSAAWWLASVA